MAGVKSAATLMPVTGSEWQGVRYGCTTRTGGVSQGPWGELNLATHVGDDPLAVAENRRRLRRELPAEPYWLNQVHGNRVVEVVEAQAEHVPPEADAAVTTTPGVVLAVMTADCVPVVVADMQGRAVGVAHAGWRGLACGVLEVTVDALRASIPGNDAWRAWVGPCIGQPNFEVGQEVREAFVTSDETLAAYFIPGNMTGKWHADLAGLARHRLVANGVHTVELARQCTYKCDKLFHSYRRQSVCGRMATLAWLSSANQC